MKSLRAVLDKGEAAKIVTFIGNVPSTLVSIFVWAMTAEKTVVKIEVEGEERFSVEVSNKGNEITVKRNVAATAGR